MSAKTQQRDDMVTHATAIASEEERAGSIGPYDVIKQIGEGLAGVVFEGKKQESDSESDSSDADSQAVALKVIKEGEDWEEILASFAAQRQTLSRIEHPNIARFIDDGTRPSGQPYFVLELAEGLPLTRHCDEHQLPLKRRLELFVTVCQAVEHAHQKGLIHGGLKPSNVVVAGENGAAEPKLLDLGIAHAIRTAQGGKHHSPDPIALGAKPEYLAPEQAGSDDPEIDTRTDVFSLGVLLYELLTGTTPLTPEELKDVSTAESWRLVREKDVAAPSARLEESNDRLSVVARRLRMKPQKLLGAVRGELDCIVKKALRKNPADRYETVHAFTLDVRRYLAGEQLEACPPTTRQMWKWAKRAPRPYSTAAATLLLLLAAFVGTGLGVWQWYESGLAQEKAQKADQKRKQAEEKEKKLKTKTKKMEEVAEIRKKERDQARQAAKEAQKSRDEAHSVLKFLRKQFLSAGRPGEVSLPNAFWSGTRGEQDAMVRKNITLREAADETESKIAGMFVDQPRTEAILREMLGTAYLNLGDAPKAVDQYQRAFELRQAMQGVDEPETADCRNQLAIALRLAGRTTEAARLFQLTPQSATQANALAAHATTLLLEKQPAEAELKLRQSLAIRQKIEPDDWTTFETESLLGESLFAQMKYADAEPRLLSGYNGMKQHEEEIPAEGKGRLISALKRLVRLYEALDKPEKAAHWRAELWAVRPP